MKRREFVKNATLLPMFGALPFIPCSADKKVSEEAESPPRKITLVRLNTHDYSKDACGRVLLGDHDPNHFARCIEEGGKFYYRVNETTVEVTKGQYRNLLSNPREYFFSRSLMILLRIKDA